MPRRLLCLHGHFYQPPRENPWIEEVEVQDSAAPFHDWNERITAECYGPNGAARLKGGDGGRIVDIVNNYLHLSFNFGPTLLAWMEREATEAYQAILAADAESVRERGHGNAIAQGYNHAILPLCTPRDLRLQVSWGLADFRHRFHREPEGFWLPECAADLATLSALADEGVRFTVLSPFQCAAVRAPGGAPWQDATGAHFDPSRPYRVALPGGRSIAVFFYDGPIARSLAFGEGLSSGEELVRRLESGFDAARPHDQVLTVAVDGETFGHHKKGGDEVLARALRRLPSAGIQIVNLGQALELCPPTFEAKILERSSWSCAHGVERWRSDCGCEAGGRPGWRQHWRAPLRAALDELRGRLEALFTREAGKLFKEPFAAREAFVELVLDPARTQARDWLARHAGRALEPDEARTALLLLEMERQAQLMFTSCGWFFSELSGLETVQVLKYAARAIQLALEATGEDLEPRFRELLLLAPSNLPELSDGARIYRTLAAPSVVTIEGVAAHAAIAGLADRSPRGEPGEEARVFCYRVEARQRRRESTGPIALEVIHAELTSLLTWQKLNASIAVLHLSGSDFRCGLSPWRGPAEHLELERALFSRLDKLSLAQVLREVDRLFPGRDFTLRDLFIDERRRLAALLLGETLRKHERDYFQIYESNRRLMEFLREIDSPVPGPLRIAAALALSHQVDEALAQVEEGTRQTAEAREPVLRAVQSAQRLQARLELEPARLRLHRLVESRVAELCASGGPELAGEVIELVELAEVLGLHLHLWPAQNRIWAEAQRACSALDPALLGRLADKLWFDAETLAVRAGKAGGPRAAIARQRAS